MTFNRWLSCLIAILLGTLLTSCYPGYKETVADVQHTQDTIHQKEQTYNPPPPPVMEKTGAYVSTTPISLDRPPRWLGRQVTVHGANLPVTFYIDQVLGHTGATLHYDNDVPRGKLISLDYRGSVRGALDEIASKADLAYTIDNKTGAITWSAFLTKTFDVSFLPGDAKYEVGGSKGGDSDSDDSIAQGGVSGGDSGSGGSGSGSVTINYTGADLSKTNQYSNLTGTISVWKDIEKTVKNLLSKDGKVTVSQATTTITVRDHPENVAEIGAYVDKMNKDLSKQVRIQVQVLTVALSHNFDYGINWDLVRNFGAANQASLTGGLASNAATGTTFSPLALEFKGNRGAWAGTQMVIQALSQQGKVSIVTQPTVTTLNNQVAEITIQGQQSYIQSISNSVTENNSTSGVNPGVITTGFNLFLLPKIQGEKVFLQLSTTISDLESLKTINANTGNVVDNTDSQEQDQKSTDQDNDDQGGNSGSETNNDQDNDTNNDNGSPAVIQIPNIDERKFNQRSVVPSGTTLILAGFKERRNEANKSSFLYSDMLGGKGGENTTIELVLLITPVIINDGDTF